MRNYVQNEEMKYIIKRLMIDKVALLQILKIYVLKIIRISVCLTKCVTFGVYKISRHIVMSVRHSGPL